MASSCVDKLTINQDSLLLTEHAGKQITILPHLLFLIYVSNSKSCSEFIVSFKVKFYLGNGRPDCHGTKGTESIGRPDVKHEGNESTGRCADWGTFGLGLWLWIFKVKSYLGNGRPDCHGTKGMGVNRMPWCKRQPLCDLEAEETVRDRGDLRCRRFRRLILVYVDLTRLRYLKKGSYTPVFIHFMYKMHVASAWKVITLICVNLAKFHKNGKSNKNENTFYHQTKHYRNVMQWWPIILIRHAYV